MDTCRHRLGLVLVLVGTVLLAYSVRVKRQYSGEVARAVDRLKQQNPDLIEPTETEIILLRFRLGLGLVFLGTALQW